MRRSVLVSPSIPKHASLTHRVDQGPGGVCDAQGSPRHQHAALLGKCVNLCFLYYTPPWKNKRRNTTTKHANQQRRAKLFVGGIAQEVGEEELRLFLSSNGIDHGIIAMCQIDLAKNKKGEE